MPDQPHTQARSPEPRWVRLVIQQVHTTSGIAWRLIAYGDGERYCAPEFATLEALLAVFRRGLPDLDASETAALADKSASSIIFAADVLLTNEQRIALGLISISAG